MEMVAVLAYRNFSMVSSNKWAAFLPPETRPADLGSCVATARKGYTRLFRNGLQHSTHDHFLQRALTLSVQAGLSVLGCTTGSLSFPHFALTATKTPDERQRGFFGGHCDLMGAASPTSPQRRQQTKGTR
jgi:hypothetical protein